MQHNLVTPTGDLDRYGVVGHPIAHSRSPFIHGEFAAATNQHLSYERFDVSPHHFEREVRAFFAAGGRGLNITVPHKEAALQLADRLTDRARLAGAINTLAWQTDGQLLGDNTDGAGFLKDLATLGIDIKARSVLLLGAGGATRGILAPLLAAAPKSLTIANRSIDRAQELVEHFTRLQEQITPHIEVAGYEALHEPYDLIVHATSLGLSGSTPRLDTRVVGAQTDAYDLGYGAGLTPFLTWARQLGARSTHDGLGMLIEQAAESFELWRGVRPQTGDVRRKLRAALNAAL